MSFERLPLALALSITLLGGGLLLNGQNALAKPILEGRTSSSGCDAGNSKTLLIAAKDSDDVSADSSAKGGKGKDSKDKKETKAKKDAKDSDDKNSKNEKKEAADEKGGKDKKSASNEKEGKDKKALKAEKATAKENAKEAAKETAEEGGEKKKGKGGFFHKHTGDEETQKAETVPAAKSVSKKEVVVEEETTKTKSEAKAEAKTAPVFAPDDALISVLKDISKSLADGQTEQVQKIENANEKMVLGLAQEIFTKALCEPNLTANRIVPKAEEHQVKTSLTAESWSSGDVVVNDKLRGSLAAIWAKRIGGLLTVTIAGDAGQRKTADGIAIGEFMVVVTAHSPVQTGFDIQSQGDVSFWMGKLNNIMVEANCVPSADTASNADKAETPTSNADTASPNPAGGGEVKKKSIVSLSPLLTNRYRKHYELLLAADREAERIAAQQSAAAASKAEGEKGEAVAGDDKIASENSSESNSKNTNSKDSGVREGNNKDANGKEATNPEANTKNSNGKEASAKVASKDASSVGNSSRGDGSRGEVSKASNTGGSGQIAMAVNNGTAAASDSANTAATVVDAGPHFHLPSTSSTLLMPERALAGQYVTVALLDRGRAPEANVELSFNGASLATDNSGQAVYQIPDDTTPGRSLNIALSARPDEVPATIEVLQPLNITTGQAPRLDRMTPLAIKDSIMTVDGHNFDGMAHNNSVIVDGSLEGHIVSASPFQLKLLLPQGLRPGPHSLCVSTDGMRSNLGGFDYADTLVLVDGKDSGKENSSIKLLVKVIGTTAKMNVKILNQTPDVIRLNRGAEMTVTSSGGFDNTIQLPAVRGKKGTFKIDTQIEI